MKILFAKHEGTDTVELDLYDDLIFSVGDLVTIPLFSNDTHVYKVTDILCVYKRNNFNANEIEMKGMVVVVQKQQTAPVEFKTLREFVDSL